MNLVHLRPLAVAALASVFLVAGSHAKDTKQPVSQDPQSVSSGKTGEGSPPADATGGATMGAGGTSAQTKRAPRNDQEKRAGRTGEGSGDPTTTSGDQRTSTKAGNASGSTGVGKGAKGANDPKSGLKGEGSANPPKSSGSTTPNS